MDALAGYGSESSSSADEEISPRRIPTLVGLFGSPLSGTDDDDEVESPMNPRKRQKLQENGGIEAFEKILPSPPTSVTCDKSIVHLDRDYLFPMLKALNVDEISNVSNPCTLKPASDSPSGQTLVQNARSRKGYYNPRFYQIVRDRFSVEKPLQSRARHTSVGLKQYEKEVFQRRRVDDA